MRLCERFRLPRIKVARPEQVSLNVLYAIYGALEGYRWDEIAEAIEEELRAEAEL
jgi:hypothetical protein